MIVGNDVSHWQQKIDFEVYRHNSNFLIIKATEGTGYIDPQFSRNQSETRRVQLLLGYYHFARPDLGNQPEWEADYFLKVVGKLQEGEILCLDYEPESNPFPVVDWCKRFMDRVQAKTGVKCLIYLNQSQVRQFDWKPVVEAGYKLWLAAYIPTEQAKPGQWGQMAIQQWTSSQKVPGILGGTGNVDGCWFFGNAEQFKSLGYKEPVVPSSSVSSSLSPSASVSPSVSPSSSLSPSNKPSESPSPSLSASPSLSQSPSPSPSPSEEIPEDPNALKLWRLEQVIVSPWWWFGTNAWFRKQAELKSILYEKNI